MKINNGLILSFLVISPLAHAVDVTKDQWIAAMKTALPTAFCSSAQYFRQCFDVTATECEETAISATRICLQDFSSQIPAVLHQPQDGTLWGTKVGECAGNAYELALIKKKISNAKCNDPANWL